MKPVAMDTSGGPASRASRAISLLDRYSRDLTDLTRTFLGPTGIGNRDFQLLLTIDQNPGLRPSTLADRLRVSRALVSQALSRFESSRLVARSIDPTDHRSARLATTRAGRTQIQAYEAQLAAWFLQAGPRVHEIHAVLGRTFTPDPASSVAPLDAVGALAAAGRAYDSEVRPLLLRFGRLTLNQRRVLTLIDARGPIRPVQLADELSLTTGGISVVLDHLETLALITRQRSSAEGDRKAVTVKLTPIGEQAVATVCEVFGKHSDQLLSALAQTMRVKAGTADELRSETDASARAAL